MAITTLDGLIDALANGRQKLPFGKTANLGTQTVGLASSFWGVAGLPGAGTLHSGAATVCNNTTVGGLNYTNPVGGAKTHLAKLAVVAGGVQSYEIHDRLAHRFSLSGIITTAQAVDLDLLAMAATSNLAERKGKDDYSGVQWWLEWSTATGSTAVTATVNVTYNDGSSGNVAVSLAASMSAGRMVPIVSAVAGLYIRDVNTVTLSATTGTAGLFGVVATLQRTEMFVASANQQAIFDWAALGFPVVYDSSCLFFIGITSAVTTQAPSGAVTLVQG